MLSAFQEELQKLKKNLGDMADLVDSQITYANKALHELDPGLCNIVKSRDNEVDAYDNLIRAQSENLLALFQPVALDLRYIIAAIMINNQLERCGDIAVNMVQRVQKVINNGDLITEFQVDKMADAACQMTHDVIDAFRTRNVDQAQSVRDQDDVVDNYNKQIFSLLVEKMKSDAGHIEPCAHLLVLTRHLERLGDHSTNIAEDIIFWIKSEIVSHQGQSGKTRVAAE